MSDLAAAKSTGSRVRIVPADGVVGDAELRHEFANSGAVALQDIANADDMAAIAKTYTSVMNQYFIVPPRPTILYKVDFTPTRCPEFYALDFFARLRRVAGYLLDATETSELVIWAEALEKAAGAGPTPWHQDPGFWGSTSYSQLTGDSRAAVLASKYDFRGAICWMPLHDVGEDNSCIWVAPESHRALRAHTNEPTTVREWDGHCRVGDTEAEACPLRAGDAVMMDIALAHMTGPNNSAHPRRSISLLILHGEGMEDFLRSGERRRIRRLRSTGRMVDDDIAAERAKATTFWRERQDH